MKDKILNIEHRFNPLHVYCRLIERGMNKRFSLSICRYYEILIYSWLGWFTIVAVRTCRPPNGRIIVKMLLVFSCAVTLFLGVAAIAKAIPIESTLTLQKSTMPQVQGVPFDRLRVRLSASGGRRTLDNAGDAVSSAFSKSEQHGRFFAFRGCHW